MDTHDSPSIPPRPRRRRVRAAAPESVPVHSPARGGRHSLNLSLEAATIQRIKGLALVKGCTVSDLITSWSDEHCKGLVLCVRSRSESAAVPETPTPEIAEPTAA